ncbi:MAG: hypothetical protein CL776_05030 [Chloroflexi bacterium]|nr:hypothetical protein [Chloroflexota bacterium]
MINSNDLSPDSIFLNASGLITMAGTPLFDRNLTAIAVRNGTIVAIGDDESIMKIGAQSKVFNFNQSVVMPGLVDSHNHFLGTALGWERLQLEEARSIEEILSLIESRINEINPGDWVLCSSRWHETKLKEGRLPTAQELDKVSPHNPIYLPRGGHVVVTNSKGLKLAGISEDALNPEGGEYVRDSSGHLTGMLLERPAFIKLSRLLPKPTDRDREHALRKGIAKYNECGITAVRDPALTEPEVRAFKSVIPDMESMRASMLLRVDLSKNAIERRKWIDNLGDSLDSKTNWLDVWGLKVGIDGGVEGGFFFEPYANNSNFRGLPLTDEENLFDIINQAQEIGWKIGVHVVGDAAMQMVLEAFEKVDSKSGVGVGGNALEHAFSPVEGSIQRTKDLGLGVTLQHALVYALGGNMCTYWGEQRASDCTPSKAWIDSGTLVGAGTDSPVTNYDPWLNIYGFATRDTEVAGVLGPQHRISIPETLQAYTMGSAKILRMDDSIGSLEVNKAADFICLDRNPMEVTVDAVKSTKVAKTIVAGKVVFDGSG